MDSLVELEVAIVVGDALSKVDVAGLPVALGVEELGAEDGNGAITLDGEVGVLAGVREVLAVPGEVAIDVANELVKVDLGVLPLAVTLLEAGPQDVAIVDTDVLSGVVESHCELIGWVREVLVVL